MCPREKRGPQTLAADRRQARPMALRGAPVPAGRPRAVQAAAPERPGRRPHERPAHEPSPPGSPLLEHEPGLERAFRAAARVSGHLLGAAGRLPGDGVRLAWSEERQAVEGRVRVGRARLAPRLRSVLHVDSDEEAEALLSVDLEWLRYPRPEQTADVAALVPADLGALTELAPLLKTPRWKRLDLVPPRLADGR